MRDTVEQDGLNRSGAESVKEPMGSVDDPELVAFLTEIRPLLVRALTAHTGSRPVAEDLAQEALVRCIERWDELATVANRPAWAMRVAFNLATSRWRRLAVERRHRREPPPDPPPTDELLALRQALDQLPARQRAAVICRHLRGFDVRASAAALGCAEGTVKSLTSQGLASIRSRLTVEVSEPPVADAPDPAPALALDDRKDAWP